MNLSNSGMQPQQLQTSISGTVVPIDEPFDLQKEIQIIHRVLINTLSGCLPYDGYDYDNFLEIAKAFKVTNTHIAECKRKQNLRVCFDALENMGELSAGSYQTLERMAKLSKTYVLVQHIDYAKKNIEKLITGNYIGTRHEVLTSLVKEAVEEAMEAKQIPKVGIQQTLHFHSTDKESEKLAEDIVFKVINIAVNKIHTSNDVQTFQNILKTVYTILSDLEKNGISVVGVDKKCIVIAVQYETCEALLCLLDYSDSKLLKGHLEELSKNLGQHIATNIQITFSITNNDLSNIWQEMENFLRVTKLHQENVCMSLEYSTAEGFKHLVNYLESGGAENNLNQLSEELSVHIGKPIKVTASLDLNQVHEALSNADIEPSSQKSILAQTKETRKLESRDVQQMEDNNSISDLVEKAKEALSNSLNENAKTNARNALILASIKKEKFIGGLCSTVTEQTLANWFGECAFVLHKTGEYLEAAESFYTATVFDPEWTLFNHINVSSVLWGKIVYSKQPQQIQLEYPKIRTLLIKIEKLSKLAECRSKVHVCFAIDCDVNRTHDYLANISVGPADLDRKESYLRTARYFLTLEMHGNVKWYCDRVLKDFSEYDDPEAFEIMARSLYMTRDFEVALDKCNEATRYTKSEQDKLRLEQLRKEILEILDAESRKDVREFDNEWLEGTHVNTYYQNKQDTGTYRQSRTKKRHKRPKAINRLRNHSAPPLGRETASGQSSASTSSGTPITTPKDDSGVSRKIGRRKKHALRRLRTQSTTSQRSRSSSISSAITNQPNVFESMNWSPSDSDTDDAESELFQNEQQPHLTATWDVQKDIPIDEPTFYEQSWNYYEGREQSSHLEESLADEKLLKDGLMLNMSFMHKYNSINPAISDEDVFYSRFLNQTEQMQLLRENPLKYVRCLLQMEGPHEAICTPVESTQTVSVIEISGRSKIGQAFNRDEVLVEILDDNNTHEKRYGKVLGVMNRQRYKDVKYPVFICTLDEMENYFVRPLCKTIPKIKLLHKNTKRSNNAKSFEIDIYHYDKNAKILCDPRTVNINPADQRTYVFLVAFITWDRRFVYPLGAIIKVIPWGNSVSTGLQILSLQLEVPKLYNKTTIDMAQRIINSTSEEQNQINMEGRTDLTALNTFTIDPPNSRNLDDALSIECTPDGFKVGVHIADVSALVMKGTPVDEEAYARAVTFYSGIRSPRHMLPEPLSYGCFSLLPNMNKQTVSVMFLLDANGRQMQMEGKNYEILLSVIRSNKQFSYRDAQDIIMKKEAENRMDIDIKKLHELAKKIRHRRLGDSMFAMTLDTEENEEDDSWTETLEAHYLVEEFMIMANRKVTQWLYKFYPTCVPIRCQPPPSEERLKDFIETNTFFIDVLVRLQDKYISDPFNKRSFNNLLMNDQLIKNQKVMITRSVWDVIVKEANKSNSIKCSKCIRTDDLHPLQHIIYQNWLSIQEKAEYRCSTNKTKTKENSHYSLDFDMYTHFTSPIRRYIDLIIHRMVHSALLKQQCPYTRNEIEQICIHINDMTRRAKDYQRGCLALQQAIDFKLNPQVLNSFADEISDRRITLCTPLMKYVFKSNRQLKFNLLNMGIKPETGVDPNTQWANVKATWRKRIYDCTGYSPHLFGTKSCQPLYPHKGVVFIALQEWVKIVKCAVDERFDDLKKAIERVQLSRVGLSGSNDVTTECRNPQNMQPNTTFSLAFNRGQIVKIQMSAEPQKGLLTSKPMLYNMTNNVKLCLQHTDDPVLHLFRYVTTSTCDQYSSTKTYLDRWLPLIQMEAATGVVSNEESCCINNVLLKFNEGRKGKFLLTQEYCETRNIEFSGTVSDDDDDDDENNRKSYDWLCLKAMVTKDKLHEKNEILSSLATSDCIWIGHATIRSVKKKNDTQKGIGRKLVVSFELHERAPIVPNEIKGKNTKFSVEILRKTEIDRRMETIIQQLTAAKDTLAEKIALNRKIPKLDKKQIRIVSLLEERDLSWVEPNSDDPQHRPLPRNNKKQQEAVDKALISRFSLIQGPPGTGKTYTGIKLIYLFAKINQELSKKGSQRKQVLFCGPSNKSVDLVARWMRQRMGRYCPSFVRIYGRSIEAMDFPIPGRTFPSKQSTRDLQTDDILKPVALHHLIRQKGKPYAKDINDFDNMFKKTNYSLFPSSKVKEYMRLVRDASIEEIKKHDVLLCTTAVGSNTMVLKASTVNQVIIDEAGMCPEPQCLVPIIATKAEQVVLIGDHKQLRPIIKCKQAGELGLEKSLFERYALMDSANNVQFTMLEQQYRMNPEICRFPSKQFYESKLLTKKGLWRDDTMDIWPTIGNKMYPHVFIHIEGEEKVLTVSTEDGNERSRSNEAEIKHVVKVFQYLINESVNDINIISQYNAQCAEIRRELNKEPLTNFNVSTVVSSQGGEWDYVIFSTVRSLPEYKIEKNATLGWCKHNLGFITDRNQINVALTRARKGLIIIGNKNLLCCDHVWRKLLDHYNGLGCIKTPDEFPPPPRPRWQKMAGSHRRNIKKYADTMFEPGKATFFDGKFDDG